MKDNSEFGHIIAPLMKPIYTLQMARSKSWSKEAKKKHLEELKKACALAELRAHLALVRLDNE